MEAIRIFSSYCFVGAEPYQVQLDGMLLITEVHMIHVA